MRYIIVWRKSRQLADINDWHEPNTYNSIEDAVKAMSTWLYTYDKGYYDIIEWTDKVKMAWALNPRRRAKNLQTFTL